MFLPPKFQITKKTIIQSVLHSCNYILIGKTMVSYYGKLVNNFEEGFANA